MGYIKGQLVRCVGVWKDKTNNDAAIDPTTVAFKFMKPGVDPVTYIHGVNAELVRESDGIYHVDLTIDEIGVWYYKFYSFGTAIAAAVGTFTVDESIL